MRTRRYHETLVLYCEHVVPCLVVNNDRTTCQAFEWIIRDAQKLKDYVENTVPPVNSDAQVSDSEHATNGFDILKESPTLGDGKFTLEIGKCIFIMGFALS